MSTYETAHDDWTPGYESSLTMPLNFDYDVDMATAIDWDSLESPYMFGEELCRSSSNESGERGRGFGVVERKWHGPFHVSV